MEQQKAIANGAGPTDTEMSAIENTGNGEIQYPNLNNASSSGSGGGIATTGASVPTGRSAPTGSMPTGSVPPGSTPTGSVPPGSTPTGSVPLGSTPPGESAPIRENETKPSRYTQKHRETVNRLLTLAANDYYGILGVNPDASNAEIRNQYRNLSLATHPDKNVDQDATECFKKVSEAWQVLGQKALRRAYDADKKSFKNTGLEDSKQCFNEEFGGNAFDDGSEDESDSEDAKAETTRKENAPTIGEPDKVIKDIYQQATPFVNDLFSDDAKDSSTMGLLNLNKQIEKQNEKERYEENQFLFPVGALLTLSHDLRATRKEPDSPAALERMIMIEDAFLKLKRTNGYPEAWSLGITSKQKEMIDKARKEKKARQDEMLKSFQKAKTTKLQNPGKGTTDGEAPGPSTAERKGKGRAETSSSTANPRAEAGESSTTQRKGKDKAPQPPSNETQSKKTPLSRDESEGSVDAPVVRGRRQWAAGETRHGEKILGYVPSYVFNRSTGERDLLRGVQFVIEKKGQVNPVALVSGEDVGTRAKNAYLDLPADQKKDLRYSERRYSRQNMGDFGEILGFASKPFETLKEGSTAYPQGYGYVRLKNGEKDFLSRTALRGMLGRKDADNEISEFYEDINEVPPWKIQPKSLRIETARESKQRRALRESSSRTLESDSGYDSEENDGRSKTERKQKTLPLNIEERFGTFERKIERLELLLEKYFGLEDSADRMDES